MTAPRVLSIEEEAVVHACPFCILPFAGFGRIDDETRRYLEAAHRDCLDAENTIREARRHLYAVRGCPLPPVSTRRWAQQERSAIFALERLHAQMQSRINGTTPAETIDLWGAR
jgi:hypothetical protein